MKSYPRIDSVFHPDVNHVFDKLDGSNIRAEWTKKKGFCKFGRRRGLLDDSNPILQRAPDLILAKYGDSLSRIFREQRWQKAIAFFEFWGPNSAYGGHDENEQQDVTLIDVAADKKGIVPPRNFMKLFGDVDHAALLYQGPVYFSILDQARDGTLEGMTFEGIVCKGPCTRPGLPIMSKVKNKAWLEGLHGYCNGDEDLFRRLQ